MFRNFLSPKPYFKLFIPCGLVKHSTRVWEVGVRDPIATDLGVKAGNDNFNTKRFATAVNFTGPGDDKQTSRVTLGVACESTLTAQKP